MVSSRMDTPRSNGEGSFMQKKGPPAKVGSSSKKIEAKHKRSVSDTEKTVKFKQNLLHMYFLPPQEPPPSATLEPTRQPDERECASHSKQEIRKPQVMLHEKEFTPSSSSAVTQKHSPRPSHVRVKSSIHDTLDQRSDKQVLVLMPQKYQGVKPARESVSKHKRVKSEIQQYKKPEPVKIKAVRGDKTHEVKPKQEVRFNNCVKKGVHAKGDTSKETVEVRQAPPHTYLPKGGVLKGPVHYVRHFSLVNTPGKGHETEEDRSIEGEGEPQKAYSKQLSPNIDKYHQFKNANFGRKD